MRGIDESYREQLNYWFNDHEVETTRISDVYESDYQFAQELDSILSIVKQYYNTVLFRSYLGDSTFHLYISTKFAMLSGYAADIHVKVEGNKLVCTYFWMGMMS